MGCAHQALTGGIGRIKQPSARQEIGQWKNFDYLIVSTSVAEDVRRLAAILDGEQMRQGRAQLPPYEPPAPGI